MNACDSQASAPFFSLNKREVFCFSNLDKLHAPPVLSISIVYARTVARAAPRDALVGVRIFILPPMALASQNLIRRRAIARRVT